MFLITLFLVTTIHALFPAHANFLLSNLYIFLANTFLSLPHEPVIIMLGKKYHPAFVTGIALIPTFFACVVDVDILKPLMKRSKFSAIKRYRSYQWLEKKFTRIPFLTTIIVAATPLPFTIIRILSLLAGYSKWNYALGVTIGRIPRYFALAYFGRILQIPDWIMIAIFILFLTIPLFEHVLHKRKDSTIAIDLSPEVEKISIKN